MVRRGANREWAGADGGGRPIAGRRNTLDGGRFHLGKKTFAGPGCATADDGCRPQAGV